MDNMQDKLRSKDQNDLEAQSHMRRKVMNLEHELEDQRRGNVELKRAKEQVEKENAQLKENLKSLQSVSSVTDKSVTCPQAQGKEHRSEKFSAKGGRQMGRLVLP